jgi:hypothetical protein
MNAPFPRSLRAVVLLAAMACDTSAGTPEAADRWGARIDTLPNAVVRVTNQPPAGEVHATHTVVEELRIGTLDGGVPTSFGQIKGLVVTADGELVVLDATAS